MTDVGRKTFQVIYTWPNGKKEVRYSRPANSEDAIDLQRQVDAMRNAQGDDCCYSYQTIEVIK